MKLGLSLCLLLFLFSLCMAGQTGDEIELKARKGDINAQYKLGLKYYKGQGVPKNNGKAMKWFKKAAEQGHADAQYNLGVMYDYDVEIPGEEEAYNAQKKYADQENLSNAEDVLISTQNLIHNFNQFQFEASKWYKKAALQGHAEAQHELGMRYAMGEGGLKEDYVEAAKWWKKAAEKGHSRAQYELGMRYHDGEGVSQSYAKAVKWWEKAAAQGDPSAQYQLGFMHYEGKGTPISFVEAYPYLSVAAALNKSKVKALLPDIREKLTPAQIAQGRKKAQILLDKVIERYPGKKGTKLLKSP